MSSQNSSQPGPLRPLRLLCFDGGGVRGLASLCLLRSILSYVGNPKPCEYFDMIGGTSTGGLIAIMLGRLEMTIDDAIETYCRMMGDVFKRKNIVPINPFNTKVLPKYDAAVLKDKIIGIVEANGEAPGAKFRAHPPKKCRVFVVAKRTEPSSTVFFTDWVRDGEESLMYNEVTISDVALATTAASTFFPPAKIDFNGITFKFVDGGLGENNPIVALRDLSRDYFDGRLTKSFGDDLTVILSIGTGVPPSYDIDSSVKGLVRLLIALAAKTQETHNAFMSQIRSTSLESKYMRFNPPDLMAQVKLDDYKDQAKIINMAARYSEEEDTKNLFFRFRAVAEPPISKPGPGHFVALDVPPRTRAPVSPSLPWHALGKDENSIDWSAQGYWCRMKLKSFRIYEKIYESCQKDGGYVHYDSFRNQLPPNSTPAKSLERVWSRLYRSRDGQPAVDSQFPKGFVLAVAYMLHVESIRPDVVPTDDRGTEGAVANDRREQIKRWPNWVHCNCTSTCRTEWNFANDLGLVRNGGTADQCDTVWWQTAGRVMRSLHPGRRERFAKLQDDWGKTRYEHGG